MKKVLLMGAFLLGIFPAFAQKVDYKDGLIKADGKDIAKVVKIKDKENFGLTSTYELYSLSGEKLIIATLSTEFKEARDDNSSYYYRFTFLTANQVGIFALSKLSTEKSFAKLIGQSGIVVNDSIDSRQLTEFIARRGSNPKIAKEYRLVNRNRMFGVLVKQDNQITQGNVLIGLYKDISNGPDVDTYQFSLPDGLILARVSFRGGNNAENFSVTTEKDELTQMVKIPTDGKYGKILSSIDRNVMALERIAKWLADHNYL